MPIFHSYKTVFIHIPKCGGSSVEEAFDINTHINDTFCEDTMFGENSQHYTYDEILRKSKKDVSKYFSFAFVRNPWSRLVSEYFWRRNVMNTFKDCSFLEFIKNIVPTHKGVHFKQQSEFILDINDNILIDYVGKIETFDTDWQHVCNTIDKDTSSLCKVNSTQHKHYTKYYNNESREIVATLYARDIKCFNYNFI